MTWSSGFAATLMNAGSAVNQAPASTAATAGRDHAADTQHEADEHVHPEAAKLVNPVPSAPSSLAAGRKLYESQCVSCHGATGQGDGKAGAQLTPKPANLADASWTHGSSDGEIYTLLKDGSKGTAMKGYASKMTAPELWSVVNYLRTLNIAK